MTSPLPQEVATLDNCNRRQSACNKIDCANCDPSLLKINTHCYRYVSKLWAMHVLSANVNMCCVCCMCCLKLVVNKNWWCGSGQMLVSLQMALAVYHSYIHPLAPK